MIWPSDGREEQSKGSAGSLVAIAGSAAPERARRSVKSRTSKEAILFSRTRVSHSLDSGRIALALSIKSSGSMSACSPHRQKGKRRSVKGRTRRRRDHRRRQSEFVFLSNSLASLRLLLSPRALLTHRTAVGAGVDAHDAGLESESHLGVGCAGERWKVGKRRRLKV